jgi:signal transduction histidine kinase
MGEERGSDGRLAEAIQSFANDSARDSHAQIHTNVDVGDIPVPLTLLIYHVMREGVRNALKQAHASDIRINVSRRSEWVELELQDNGRGFDTSLPGPEGHYGMTMMRERAMVAGGTFGVESSPGRGTVITARFPLAPFA